VKGADGGIYTRQKGFGIGMRLLTKTGILAFGFVLCFLTVSTLSAAAFASHAPHVGHDHTTHQQSWCGWLCAAGQGMQSPSLEPPPTFVAISLPPVFTSTIKLVIFAHQAKSRAPPAPLT